MFPNRFAKFYLTCNCQMISDAINIAHLTGCVAPSPMLFKIEVDVALEKRFLCVNWWTPNETKVNRVAYQQILTLKFRDIFWGKIEILQLQTFRVLSGHWTGGMGKMTTIFTIWPTSEFHGQKSSTKVKFFILPGLYGQNFDHGKIESFQGKNGDAKFDSKIMFWPLAMGQIPRRYLHGQVLTAPTQFNKIVFKTWKGAS